MTNECLMTNAKESPMTNAKGQLWNRLTFVFENSLFVIWKLDIH